MTHVQELESCTVEILLKALRDVSRVPKEACEHELKVRIATSREGVVPRARARLVASPCEK